MVLVVVLVYYRQNKTKKQTVTKEVAKGVAKHSGAKGCQSFRV